MKVLIQEKGEKESDLSLIIAIPTEKNSYHLQITLSGFMLFDLSDTEFCGSIKHELVAGNPDSREMKAVDLPLEMVNFFLAICKD